MSQEMVKLLHTRYHPSRATKRKEAGIFNDYEFKDGTTLRVRRMFEKRLFYPKGWRVKRLRRKPLWQQAEKLGKKFTATNYWVVLQKKR